MLTMPKKLPVVFVRIRWKYAVERMRLDLAAIAAKPPEKITSHEVWPGEGVGAVTYQPRLKYRADSNGNHIVALEYLEKDHPDLQSLNVPWGTATLTIPRNLTCPSAEWVGLPGDGSLDGKTKKVELRVEGPSDKKAQVVEARTAQARFKQDLLEMGQRCAITGETLRAVLDAAHVQAVEDDGPDEAHNGILLRADLHRLYDAGYFTIKQNGTLSLHRDLPDNYRKELQGVKIEPNVIERIRPYLSKRKPISVL